MKATLLTEFPRIENVPSIRILYRRPDSEPVRRRHGWRLSAIVIALSFLSLGAAAKYVKPANVKSLPHNAALPDYARYQWNGFHRTMVAVRAPGITPAYVPQKAVRT